MAYLQGAYVSCGVSERERQHGEKCLLLEFGQAKSQAAAEADCLKFVVAGRIAANVVGFPALHTGLDVDLAVGGDNVVELAVDVVGGGIGQGVVQAVEDALSAVGGADGEDIAGAGNAGVLDAVVEAVGDVVDDAVAPADISPRAAPTMVPRSCLEVAESSLAVAKDMTRRKLFAALTHSFARQPQG